MYLERPKIIRFTLDEGEIRDAHIYRYDGEYFYMTYYNFLKFCRTNDCLITIKTKTGNIVTTNLYEFYRYLIDRCNLSKNTSYRYLSAITTLIYNNILTYNKLICMPVPKVYKIAFKKLLSFYSE